MPLIYIAIYQWLTSWMQFSETRFVKISDVEMKRPHVKVAILRCSKGASEASSATASGQTVATGIYKRLRGVGPEARPVRCPADVALLSTPVRLNEDGCRGRVWDQRADAVRIRQEERGVGMALPWLWIVQVSSAAGDAPPGKPLCVAIECKPGLMLHLTCTSKN